MSIFSTFNIAASGIYAHKRRMDIVAQNITNADTILTETGEPYKRKIAVISGLRNEKAFKTVLDSQGNTLKGEGVAVTSVIASNDPFKLEYNPEHPLANADGYVRIPNVDTASEMLEMIAATRAYEANVTIFNNAKAMFSKALEIGGR